MDDIDLERLARAYQHRAGEGVPSKAGAAADAAELGSGRVAVDIGGGTGAHAVVFAARAAAAVVVDPSLEMCRVASESVSAVRARGESLPLGSEVADLAYFHMSIHHGDWRRMLGEAMRILRPGGTVWVWTLSRDHHRHSFLAQWFPSVAEIDERRFPDPDDLADLMESSGCVGVEQEASVTEIERTAGEWAGAVDAGFVSTLHLVGADELAAGLHRFRRRHPDPAAPVRYALRNTRVSGQKP